MLIDTHAHLNFSSFDKDREEVIDRCLDNDLWVINIGTKYETSRKAVEIAVKPGIFASVGLHPIHLEEQKIDTAELGGQPGFKTKEEEFDYLKYKELASHPKVVAIGEIGLDYWYKPKTKGKLEAFKEKQKAVFLKQIDLAKELGYPVIIHCRLAHNELLEILKKNDVKGVIHCFTGDWKQAEQFLDMGFYLGFNGIIFKLGLDEVIKKAPLDKILVETDCPYLTPPQERDRNEPLYVKYVIEKIAGIRKIGFNDLAEATSRNARLLFSL